MTEKINERYVCIQRYFVALHWTKHRFRSSGWWNCNQLSIFRPKSSKYLLTGELNFSLQMLEFQVNKLVFNWTFSEREKIVQRKYQPFFTRNLVKNTKQASILSCCYFCWVFFPLLLVYKFSSILLSFPILRSHLLSLAFFFLGSLASYILLCACSILRFVHSHSHGTNFYIKFMLSMWLGRMCVVYTVHV